jgi:hypothetical protein
VEIDGSPKICRTRESHISLELQYRLPFTSSPRRLRASEAKLIRSSDLIFFSRAIRAFRAPLFRRRCGASYDA